MNESQFPGSDSAAPISPLELRRQILDACERFEREWWRGERDYEAIVAAIPPVHRGVVREALAEVAAELEAASAPAGHDQASALGQRFEVLRPLASGGMGVVSEAFDLDLRRRVALKEILPAGADNEAYRQRFLNEAEITGRLEHPGIIPVYGRGRQADGRPYYAMRLISGTHTGNLHQALRRFHEATPRDPSEADLAWRGLLRRVIDVCNTMAYVHSQGVLHRDLKPANILLGPYGETLVVDWGLAKDLRRPAGAGHLASEARAPSTESVPDQGGTPSTNGIATGGIGTLGHASPEQLTGDPRAASPASDIYSLGTILYAVLTGQSPFSTLSATPPSQVLRQVETGRFPRPRQLNPRIDRGLEAICLRAMAANPASRYASAADLAADLERYLADEPVSVWREPPLVRARRWITRHRTLVSTLTVALALTALAASVVAVLQTRNRQILDGEARKLEAALRLSRIGQQAAERERGAAQRAQQAAEEERAKATAAQAQAESDRNRAIDRETLAVAAVDEFRRAVAQHRELANAPQFAELRQELLRQPLHFYRKLREQLRAVTDPALGNLEALRGATAELAKLHAEVGDVAEALRLHQDVLQLCDQALAHPGAQATPIRRQWQRTKAATYLDLGWILFRTDNKPDELRNYEQALALLEVLRQENPLDGDLDELRATALGGKAEVLHGFHRLDESRECFEEGVRLRRVLVERRPEDSELQRRLGRMLVNQSRLLDRLNESAAANEARRRAEELFSSLGENMATIPEFRHREAAAHYNRGVHLSHEGHWGQSLAAYRAAEQGWRGLLDEMPAQNEYRNALRLALQQQAELLSQHQQLPECAVVLRRLADLQRASVAQSPQSADYRGLLVEALHSLGHMQTALGDGDGALGSYADALSHAELLRSALADDRRWPRQIVELTLHLADQDLETFDVAAARRRYEQARPLAVGLVEGGPATPQDRQMLRALLVNLARILEFTEERELARQTRALARNWDQHDEAIAQLDRRLDEVLAGTPANTARELAVLARRGTERGEIEGALNLCVAALQAEPALVADRQLQLGALAAGLALRVAADLPAEAGERAGDLRRQALEWLRLELRAWEEAGPEQEVIRRRALLRWRVDPLLGLAAQPERLARWPAEQQPEWRALFARAARLANPPLSETP